MLGSHQAFSGQSSPHLEEFASYPAGTASSTKFQPLFTLANHFFALFSQSEDTRHRS